MPRSAARPGSGAMMMTRAGLAGVSGQGWAHDGVPPSGGALDGLGGVLWRGGQPPAVGSAYVLHCTFDCIGAL